MTAKLSERLPGKDKVVDSFPTWFCEDVSKSCTYLSSNYLGHLLAFDQILKMYKDRPKVVNHNKVQLCNGKVNDFA